VVYIVVLAQSCLQQFFRAAEQSLMPQLVEPRQLVTANALNSQTNDIARLIWCGTRRCPRCIRRARSIPVLITQGLGFVGGGAVVLTRRRLFAAPGTPDRAQVHPIPAWSLWLKSVSGLSSGPLAPRRRGVGMRSPRG
jgi:hypothetical protein